MQYLLMALFAGAVVGVDQWVKALVVAHIPLRSHQPLIPGVVGLTYTQNTGAAFSMLRGQQWLFALIFLIFTLAVIWEFWNNSMKFTTFERWCIVAVWAGGLGNMIDRLRLGYVVDMIATEFIVFPVFNVADCFITCGVIALMIHMVFCSRDFRKGEQK